MTNFCLLDALLVAFLAVTLIISVESAIALGRRVGYAYLFCALLAPILLYANVYKLSTEANITEGSTWARLHLFLQGYLGEPWVLWLTIAIYALLAIVGAILGWKLYKKYRETSCEKSR